MAYSYIFLLNAQNYTVSRETEIFSFARSIIVITIVIQPADTNNLAHLLFHKSITSE